MPIPESGVMIGQTRQGRAPSLDAPTQMSDPRSVAAAQALRKHLMMAKGNDPASPEVAFEVVNAPSTLSPDEQQVAQGLALRTAAPLPRKPIAYRLGGGDLFKRGEDGLEDPGQGYADGVKTMESSSPNRRQVNYKDIQEAIAKNRENFARERGIQDKEREGEFQTQQRIALGKAGAELKANDPTAVAERRLLEIQAQQAEQGLTQGRASFERQQRDADRVEQEKLDAKGRARRAVDAGMERDIANPDGQWERLARLGLTDEQIRDEMVKRNAQSQAAQQKMAEILASKNPAAAAKLMAGQPGMEGIDPEMLKGAMGSSAGTARQEFLADPGTMEFRNRLKRFAERDDAIFGSDPTQGDVDSIKTQADSMANELSSKYGIPPAQAQAIVRELVREQVGNQDHGWGYTLRQAFGDV